MPLVAASDTSLAGQPEAGQVATAAAAAAHGVAPVDAAHEAPTKVAAHGLRATGCPGAKASGRGA